MEKYLFFADLPQVLETRPVPLRRMLDRGRFTLHDADLKQGRGNRTRFTIADAVNLALIRAFVKLGQRVETASGLTQDIIEQGGVELTNIDAFAARWRDTSFLVETIDTNAWALHGIIEGDAPKDFVASVAAAIFARGNSVSLIPVGSIVAGTIDRARQVLAAKDAARERAA